MPGWGGVDVDLGTRAVHGREEGQSLDVVEVDMGHEGGGPERIGPRHPRQQARAQVEDQGRFVRHREDHTGGVGPVPPVGGEGARIRAPHAEKIDPHHPAPSSPAGSSG